MLIGRLSQMSPPPCLYDTVIQSYVQLKSGSIERTAHFMGRPTPLKVNGANFSTPPAPQGCTFTPIWRYGLTEPASLFKCGKFHISVKSTLWATRRQSFSQCKVNGANFGTLLPPGVQLLPHLRYGLTEPASLLKCGKFHISVTIHSLSYEASKFFSMLSLCGFFCPYFAPGANIVPPIAYKSHSTRFPIRPHVLTPHSWLCDKNCGRSSAPK